MREAAKSNPELSDGGMKELEEKYLLPLSSFDDGKIQKDEKVEEILVDVNKYSAWLQRKNSNNHYPKKHKDLLKERP